MKPPPDREVIMSPRDETHIVLLTLLTENDIDTYMTGFLSAV